jgi:hypothetical protein
LLYFVTKKVVGDNFVAFFRYAASNATVKIAKVVPVSTN